MSVQIYIEGQRLDLFKDENISVTSNVSDVKDLKLRADFSQSFTVPASKTNNQIFQTWYNFDVINGFDARTRKDATIDIDTLDFKRGKIRLDKAEVKNGRPVHYTITFFGNVVKIKDLIGDDRLNELTWLSNFDHDYTDTNVLAGLTTGLDFTVDSVTYTNAIIYPLVSYKRQYLFNSDPSDTTSTDTLVNIAYDAGRTDGIDWAELKPAINLPIIFEAIEQKYGLTFTGSFFDTQRFKQIYMNLSTDNNTLENGLLVVEELSGTYTVATPVNKFRYTLTVTPDAGFTSVLYGIRLYINGSVVAETATNLSGSQVVSGETTFPPVTNPEYEVKAEVITEVDFEFGAQTNLEAFLLFSYGTVTGFPNSYTGLAVDLETRITEQLQDIKVFDFLLSIIKMFNLIVESDSDLADNLYWQDQNSWYSEGQIYDITPYVDTRKTTIKKGQIYSKINFLFEESEQILANEFREANLVGYGDIEQELRDENNELLDGGELDISVIFENPIFERLTNQLDGDYTPIQYCLMLDKNLSQYTGAPFLFYAPTTPVTGWELGFVNQVGTYSQISVPIFVPSHSQALNFDSFNLNFNAEINEFSFQVYQDTLYQRGYADFINDIFSKQRRIINLKANLPVSLLHNLKLNDRFVIRDIRFIINKITSNLVNRSGTPDDLELLNDIYDAPLASDQLNTSLFSPSSGFYGSVAGTYNATYYGLSGKVVKLVTAETWITLNTTTTTSTVFEVEFTLDANTTGVDRSVQIQVLDGLRDPVFTVNQETENVGALNFANPNQSGIINTVLIAKS